MYLLLGLVFALLVVYYASVWFHHTNNKVKNEPEMIHSFVPIIHSALSYCKNPIAFIAQYRQKYGKYWTIRLGDNRFVFVCDRATFFRRILPNKSLSLDLFVAEFNKKMFDIKGNLASSHEVEQLNRKILHQSLSRLNLEDLNHQFYEAAQMHMEALKHMTDGQEINLFNWIHQMAFYTTVGALFGIEFAQQQSSGTKGPNGSTDSLFQLFTTFEDSFNLYVSGIPFLKYLCPKAYYAREELCKRLDSDKPLKGESQLITDRRNYMVEHPDLFLSNNRHGLSKMMSGLLWGAASNTVPATFWSLLDLLLHPEELNIVLKEIETNKQYEPLYSTTVLNKYEYLESCIHETLRRIATCTIQRQAHANTTICEADDTNKQIGIRRRDIVAYPGSLDNFNDDIYPQSKQFKGNRFLDKTVVKPFDTLAFGAGNFMCPGRFWAINEIKMQLILLLTTVKIELTAPKSVLDKYRLALPYDRTRLQSLAGPIKAEVQNLTCSVHRLTK